MNKYRRKPLGRYRVIVQQAWPCFAGLDSDSAKLLLYLWIGPPSTACGILQLKQGYALTDLGWSAARLQKAWRALEKANLVWRDGDLVIVVHFLDSNSPANENVITRWRKDVAALPESRLFRRLYDKAGEWLTPDGLAWLIEKMGHAWGNPSGTVPEPFPNPSRTLREPRTQDAGASGQDPGLPSRIQEQETGEVSEGERGEPAPDPIASPMSPHDSRSIDDRNSMVDPNLVTLFAHHDPETARQLARAAKHTPAAIRAAEREVARRRMIAPEHPSPTRMEV